MNNQKQTINNSNLNDLTGADDQQAQINLTDLEANDADKIKGGPTRGGGGDIIVFDIVDS